MHRRLLPLLCALLLGVGAALLAGCGDRANLIPPSDASALNSELKAVQQAVGAQDCGKASSAISRARSAVDNLPKGVDTRLKSRLKGGLGQLSAAAARSCNSQPTTTATTTTQVPTTQETAPPQTTSTADTSPTTPADTTTTQQTTPSTPSTPTQTTPDGGVTPTTPTTTPGATQTDPSGGVTPGGPSGGTGFRAVPNGTAPGAAGGAQRHHRDHGAVQGYFP